MKDECCLPGFDQGPFDKNGPPAGYQCELGDWHHLFPLTPHQWNHPDEGFVTWPVTPSATPLPPKPKPKPKRHDLFTNLGLHPERMLGTDVADFYLTESMIGFKRMDGLGGDVYDGDGMAVTLFERHVNELAREFSIYLDMAVGGELRHAWDSHSATYPDYPMPKGLDKYMRFVKQNNERSACWKEWMRLRKKAPKQSLAWLKWAADIFVSDSFHEQSGNGVGGSGWATAARVVYDYLCGTMKARTFVDRAFTLEHNFGCIFDKTYGNLGDMREALEEQAAGNYRALNRRATPFVASRYRSFARRTRNGIV